MLTRMRFSSDPNLNIHIYLHLFYLELIKLKLPNEIENIENLSEILTWIKRFMYLEKYKCFNNFRK